MKSKLGFVSLCALCGLLLNSGCGTTANLAGLGVSVNVAQKGMAAGITLAAGTNTVAVGATYAQGTNSYGVNATIPTGK